MIKLHREETTTLAEDDLKNKDDGCGEQLLNRVRETDNLGLWKVLEYLVTVYYLLV